MSPDSCIVGQLENIDSVFSFVFDITVFKVIQVNKPLNYTIYSIYTHLYVFIGLYKNI